jgi:uncharacterized protein (UPF0548 family)
VQGSVTGQVDLGAMLARLGERRVNYDESHAPTPERPGNWHVDNSRTVLGKEPPGPPVAGGAWEVACRLVREYEFADPRIIRAVYRDDDELLGRDMLLEGRFLGLRFYMGVRVTEVVDTERDGERLYGWAYETLEGHLEQGKLLYEVVKDAATGTVELRLRAYSRQAPISNPVVRLGFRLFGRRTQLRFYRKVGQRLRDSVRAIQEGGNRPTRAKLGDGLVMAPSGVRVRPEPTSAAARHGRPRAADRSRYSG